MSLSHILWQANSELIEATLHHPFVQGIGDGSLPKEKFAYYVGQDAFFLEAFARAYSIAAAKTNDWQSFQVFHALANGVLQELNLHQSYAKSWSVDISKVEPGKATRQYTDFLLATAWSQPAGITAVAMSPCLQLYAYIGQTLASNGIPNHDYADWIKAYSSDEFEPLAKQLETIVDEHASDGSLTRSTYRYAMVCEHDFFQAAWMI